MAANAELVDSLRKLGLNQYEAKAYCALSVFGNQTAGELSERADIPRPRSYDVLTKLQDKGFVLIQQGRPVKYSALSLDEAVKTLKKQREAELLEEIQKVDALSKELSSKLQPAKNVAPAEENVWTLKGRGAIYSKMSSMIADAKKHIVIASTAEGASRKLKFHEKELRKARDRGVRISVIAPSCEGEHCSIAHSMTEKELPTRMLLTDNQALMFLSGPKTKADEEVGVWLNSPHVVQTLKASSGLK